MSILSVGSCRVNRQQSYVPHKSYSIEIIQVQSIVYPDPRLWDFDFELVGLFLLDCKLGYAPMGIEIPVFVLYAFEI